jgi:hypothetical protein
MAEDRERGIAVCNSLEDHASVIDTICDEFNRLANFEVALEELFLTLVDGSANFKFAQGRMIELIDDTRLRQLDLVQKASGLKAQSVTQLKSKARMLIKFYAAEDDDAQSNLVRSITRELIDMPLREYDAPQIIHQSTAKTTTMKPPTRVRAPLPQLNSDEQLSHQLMERVRVAPASRKAAT